MSEVISFRLDHANPHEVQAFEVLDSWIEKGFSARYIFTTALLHLQLQVTDLEMDQENRDPDLGLDRIGQLLKIVKASPITTQSNNLEQPILRESFLASIKQGVKPGMKSA